MRTLQMAMCFMALTNSLALRTLQEIETTKEIPTLSKKYSTILMQKTQLSMANVLLIHDADTILSSAIAVGRKLQDPNIDFIHISASRGNVITCLQVIEYLKGRIEDLHVEYRLWNKDLVEILEEYESSLPNVPKFTFKSTTATISAVLTTKKGDTLKNSPGYLPLTPVKPIEANVFKQQMKM